MKYFLMSKGGNSYKQKIKEGPGYQVPFAERVRKEVSPSVLVGAVGKITDAQQSEEVRFFIC
jgi:2,4-dienoyl-CoA reductase-like NADH-dependent reductase (Old Yellow Enzyme family)